MPKEFLLVVKGKLANVTLVWLLSGMNRVVNFEVRLTHKGNLTNITLEWLLSNVDFHVIVENPSLAEGTLAYVAFVWFFSRVNSHMHSQCATFQKLLTAHFTLEALFAGANHDHNHNHTTKLLHGQGSKVLQRNAKAPKLDRLCCPSTSAVLARLPHHQGLPQEQLHYEKLLAT